MVSSQIGQTKGLLGGFFLADLLASIGLASPRLPAPFLEFILAAQYM